MIAKTAFRVLFVFGFVFSGNALLFAQMPVRPAQLLSENVVLLVDTPDAERLIVALKTNLYDPCYRAAIEGGFLRPLDLSFFQEAIEQKNFPKEHWLIRAIDSIHHPQFDGAEQLINSLEPFRDKHEDINLADEDRVVAALASLFSGRMFVAIENHSGVGSTLFGFEYDPDCFDWYAEMIAVTQTQNENESPHSHVDGIDVFHLPEQEIFFFSHANVLYGTSDVQPDSCHRLIQRVLQPNQENNLETSRRFVRVSHSLDYEKEHHDLFCFYRADLLLDLKFHGSINPRTNQEYLSSIKSELDGEGELVEWSDFAGMSVNFQPDQNNHYQYQVVWPLRMPESEVIGDLFHRALLDLDPRQTRMLSPFSYQWFFKFDDMSKFPFFLDFPAPYEQFGAMWHMAHENHIEKYGYEANKKSIKIFLMNRIVQIAEDAELARFSIGDIGDSENQMTVLFVTSSTKRDLLDFAEQIGNRIADQIDETDTSVDISSIEANSDLALALKNGDTLELTHIAEIKINDDISFILAQAGEMIILFYNFPFDDFPDEAGIGSLEFGPAFVLDDWFSGQLAESGILKAFTITRGIKYPAGQYGHLGVLPLGLPLIRDMNSSSLRRFASNQQQLFIGKKQPPILIQMFQALMTEIYSLDEQPSLFDKLSKSEPIMVNAMVLGEGRLFYFGLMRK